MATPRTQWDPRSEMAKDAVEAMEVAQEEPRRIVILSCGHWEHRVHPTEIDVNGQRMTYCIRDRQQVRVLQECGLGYES